MQWGKKKKSASQSVAGLQLSPSTVASLGPLQHGIQLLASRLDYLLGRTQLQRRDGGRVVQLQQRVRLQCDRCRPPVGKRDVVVFPPHISYLRPNPMQVCNELDNEQHNGQHNEQYSEQHNEQHNEQYIERHKEQYTEQHNSSTMSSTISNTTSSTMNSTTGGTVNSAISKMRN